MSVRRNSFGVMSLVSQQLTLAIISTCGDMSISISSEFEFDHQIPKSKLLIRTPDDSSEVVTGSNPESQRSRYSRQAKNLGPSHRVWLNSNAIREMLSLPRFFLDLIKLTASEEIPVPCTVEVGGNARECHISHVSAVFI